MFLQDRNNLCCLECSWHMTRNEGVINDSVEREVVFGGEMVWSIVEWIGPSGQVVRLQGKMTCRISFVDRGENVSKKVKRNPECVM